MQPPWFRKRGYKHFDAPVGEAYAKNLEAGTCIKHHAWSPLIHYEKRVKRYKRADGKTAYKPRPIMYASHRDACILSKYAADLTRRLDDFYQREGLTDHVIGYRRLGKSNYDFAAGAARFANANAPCIVLCFDVSGFFDNLDHRLLKEQLKRVLGSAELSQDWYGVFRHVTRFSYVSRAALAAHPDIGPRLRSRKPEPVASIAEVKAAGIAITPNPNAFGIPQGTPISSVFSNLYMVDVDGAMASLCLQHGALYQRYSDDILVICRLHDEAMIQDALMDAIKAVKLEINSTKTERALFDASGRACFQYLGFNVTEMGASIRPSSIARQYRKLKYSIKKTRLLGEQAIADGRADKIYTKRLRRRFYPVGVRNFSAYGRRAGKAFGADDIARQIRRIERRADQAIRELNT